jgi:hypothetical protein
MKRNLIILLLTLGTLNVFGKTPTGDKVNPAIEAKFREEFGSSVDVSWKIVQTISIATFSEQGELKDVYYFEDGQILGIGRNIKRDLLPTSVKQTISKRFDGGVIQTAYEFKEVSSPTRYFITVVTPRYSAIVSADEFGQMDVQQKIKNKSFDVSLR